MEWPMLLDENGYPYKDAKRRPIIALDGEGMNIPLSEGVESANPYVNRHGSHSYTLLVAADEHRHYRYLDATQRREAGEDIARNYGIPTVRCLDAILSLPSAAILVGFYFSYDVVKILADLPIENMRELCDESVEAKLAGRESTTVWNGYRLSYRPRKKFTVTRVCRSCEQAWIDRVERAGRCHCRRFSGGKPKEYLRSRTVYDIFGFFQKSFVSALDDATSLFSADIIERIAEMKANRERMHEISADRILDYCVNECQYLAILFRDMLMHVERVGVKLRRYDGPGAIAEAVYGERKTKRHISKAGLPESVALAGYYGGRFEVSEIGYIGDAYAYDINSAYPFIASRLPCLACGEFRRVSEYVPGSFGVYQVGSRTSGRYAPFPFRANDALADAMNSAFREQGSTIRLMDKAIFYAHGGTRWVWQNELATARAHFGDEAIPVYDGWVLDSSCEHEPFSWVPEYYAQRRELKAAKDGAEKVYKLMLNSLYGKLAQSIGWQIKNGKPQPPPYQCFVWAGLITSGTRAMILDAVMRGDVVSIATDGILTRAPIPKLEPSSKQLGAWESERVRELYLFQSGVYCGIDEDGNEFYKTRGFSPSEIPAGKLRAAWHDGRKTVSAERSATRFVPMKQGVSMRHPTEYIGQWIPSVHRVTLAHTRRMPSGVTFDEYGVPIIGDNRLSEPFALPNEWESAPYVPKESGDDFVDEASAQPAMGDHGEATADDLAAVELEGRP